MHATFILARVFRGFLAKLVILALGVMGVIAQGADSTAAAASVKITQPFEGEEFSPGRYIDIGAEAFNPNGNIYALEFYAGTNLLRRVDLAYPPNFSGPMRYGFSWYGAPAGAHTITVRA